MSGRGLSRLGKDPRPRWGVTIQRFAGWWGLGLWRQVLPFPTRPPVLAATLKESRRQTGSSPLLRLPASLQLLLPGFPSSLSSSTSVSETNRHSQYKKALAAPFRLKPRDFGPSLLRRAFPNLTVPSSKPALVAVEHSNPLLALSSS